MKTLFNSLLFCSIFILGCSPDVVNIDQEGEIYFKVVLSPALNGRDVFAFSYGEPLIEVETGSMFQTGSFKVNANQDISYEVFISSTNLCYSVSIESFFRNQRFDIREYQLGRISSNSSGLCKDGLEKLVTIKTPKY